MGLVRNVSPFHLRRSQFFGGFLVGVCCVWSVVLVFVLVCVCDFLALQLFHSDVIIIINHTFLFYSHSASSFPSPSFPWSPRHEYTLNDTSTKPIVLSPCATSLQVYTQQHLGGVCTVGSSPPFPPSPREYPWSHCISAFLI